MIYQLEILYGALINNKVIYSIVTTFDNCTKDFDYLDNVNEECYKDFIIKAIIKDGFNPNDFYFSFITKEQYDNRIESKETYNLKF